MIHMHTKLYIWYYKCIQWHIYDTFTYSWSNITPTCPISTIVPVNDCGIHLSELAEPTTAFIWKKNHQLIYLWETYNCIFQVFFTWHIIDIYLYLSWSHNWRLLQQSETNTIFIIPLQCTLNLFFFNTLNLHKKG